MTTLDPTLSVVFFANKRGNKVSKFFKKHNFPNSVFQFIPFDKAVCALSTIFLGTAYSTFSLDIERMRYGLKTATCLDSNICDGVSFL